MSKASLPSLLSSIRLTPNLPPQSWYLIAGVALSTLNRPDDVTHVFLYAIEKDGGSAEASLHVARRMREALVKAAPIGGLPKVGQCFELRLYCPMILFSPILVETLLTDHQCIVCAQEGNTTSSDRRAAGLLANGAGHRGLRCPKFENLTPRSIFL